MVQRATSLGPKPSLFSFSFFVCFCLCFCGGLTGQVRWPKGPPHLALNPAYVSFCCFLLFLCGFDLFPFFAFNRKPCFPLKKSISDYFSVSPFVFL